MSLFNCDENQYEYTPAEITILDDFAGVILKWFIGKGFSGHIVDRNINLFRMNIYTCGTILVAHHQVVYRPPDHILGYYGLRKFVWEDPQLLDKLLELAKKHD